MVHMRKTIKNLRYLQLSDTTTVWQRRLPSHQTVDFQKMQSRLPSGAAQGTDRTGWKMEADLSEPLGTRLS